MPRKSNFITDAEVPDGHFFDTFGNGVNRKISKENLFSQIQKQAQTYYYDSEDDLKAANLEADPDNPIYVRVAPSWRLYRITSLAPVSPLDIPLDNGATATLDRLENLQFVNKQDMVDSPYLKEGDIVHTAGYLSPGGGGGNDYEIVAAGTGTDDGGSFIDLAGGELQAKGLFPDRKVNIRQFGAAPVIADNATAIQNSIDYVVSSGIKRLRVPAGAYTILTTLNIKTTGIMLEGDGHGSLQSTTPGQASTIVWGGVATTMIRYGDGGTTTVFACVVKDLALDGNDAALHGFLLDDKCANFLFDNVLVFDVFDCWNLGESCFACRWTNCVSYGFESYGWRLRDKCHNSNLVGCKAWGSSTKTPLRSVRVGETEGCNNINFYGCDFETWNVSAQVLIDNADAVNFFGGYMEAKNANTLYQIQLGTTFAGSFVDGFCIHGVRMIGNTAGAHAIRLAASRNGSISGNFSAGFTDNFLFVTSGGNSNILLGPNTVGGGITEASNYSGIIKYAADGISFSSGVTPQTFPLSVTGVRGPGTGITNFLQALEDAGLINDTTTAYPANPNYAVTNLTTDRAYNADATSVDELADVLGTLISDLVNKGVLSS
jgi:hypothetical protein